MAPPIRPRETMRILLSAFAVILAGAGGAAAQSFPSRPITMVVPYTAGGPTDAVARILAEGMRASLRQTVIIDNVAGASGSIGTGRVARAAADGYTLDFGNWASNVVNAAVYTLSYDVLTDFAPVALVANQPLLITARKTLPAQDLHQLIAWLKANKASAGGAGAGSANHIASVFFEKETGTHLQFVPYRGGAVAMQDLLAGQIDMIFDLAASALPQVRGGNIKAFAVMAASRLAAAPEIPTVDEAGLPGLHVSLWSALWVPKGTPGDIVATLNRAATASLADPTVRTRLADLGQELPARGQETPEALLALQKAEIAKWWPIIRAAGIKAD
jgi:tripartite-type tricarboxylate transporter receptor subunit TctC